MDLIKGKLVTVLVKNMDERKTVVAIATTMITNGNSTYFDQLSLFSNITIK